MKYVELRYAVPTEQAELAASALTDAGAAGLEERDASTIDRPAADEVLLVTWVAPDDAEAFVERAARELAGLGIAAERTRPARVARDEDEWRDAWKRHFHARPVGRFVIVPSWEAYAPRAGEIVLDLDPGRAFGTGGHASTRLCLLALGGRPDAAPARVLDVGCGSGILAIAAARRWPALRGEGLDVDADALEVARANAARNGVAERLTFATTDVASAVGAADLVFANIQPEVLIPMAPALRARLAPGAALILAGIVDEAADEVAAAYARVGLGSPTRLREEGWTALVYERRGEEDRG